MEDESIMLTKVNKVQELTNKVTGVAAGVTIGTTKFCMRIIVLSLTYCREENKAVPRSCKPNRIPLYNEHFVIHTYSAL